MGGSGPPEGSGLSVLWSLRTLKIAQGALRAAQSCSESLRAAQSRPERSLGAVRGTAQGRTERAQSCSAPLRIARCVPRATQSRSESPCALRAAPSLLVAACARSEPAQDRLCPRNRCCSARLLGFASAFEFPLRRNCSKKRSLVSNTLHCLTRFSFPP